MIFTSVLGPDTEGYDETAEEMELLAAQQPGYLGIDAARDPRSRVGITVSYWRTERDASAWKRVAEHVDAQRRGRDRWYVAYSVHVAAVTRGYSSTGPQPAPDSAYRTHCWGAVAARFARAFPGRHQQTAP